MEYSLEFPVFLIPHGGGYASMMETQDAEQESESGEPDQYLVVLTDEEEAVRLMHRFQILGAPRSLQNAREFRWLLQSIRPPVTRVAIDPDPDESGVNAQWSFSIQEMLDEHISVDYSPWNYPIFVIAQESGFVSIGGADAEGLPITAIGVFTASAKAQKYLEDADEKGTLCRLADLDETRRFLEGVADQISAAAIDPVVDEDRRLAKYCFPIETLLEKYLVVDEDEGEEDGPTLLPGV